MVSLLDEDEVLNDRYRRESTRCAAERARREYGKDCEQELEERLDRRFAAEQAQMDELLTRVGVGCRRALREGNVLDMPEQKSLVACVRDEGQ
jgi:DNA-binding transcriptional regulator YbjK